MYKDKKRQREANRKAQAKFKAKGIIEQGITNQTKANQVIPNIRRGKDIKCFADLPLDVQQNINRISESNEEKQKRTAIVINYQHVTCSVTKEGIKFGQA